jgi:isocitrate dehydrogenase
MLVHIGQGEVATRVHNAWLRTIEDGIHTYDIFEEGVSKQKVGTRAFADAVIERIGQVPETLRAVEYRDGSAITVKVPDPVRADKTQVGIDVFLHWDDGTPDDLAQLLLPHADDGLRLNMVSNRGQKVWPEGSPETLTTDHWRCRFMAPEGSTTTALAVIELQRRLADAGLDPIKTEGLFAFDGTPAFTKGQGQ